MSEHTQALLETMMSTRVVRDLAARLHEQLAKAPPPIAMAAIMLVGRELVQRAVNEAWPEEVN